MKSFQQAHATAVATFALALALAAPVARAADEPVLNLYSARHYQTDEALYDNFTKATGIKINRIEAGDDAAARADQERRRERAPPTC